MLIFISKVGKFPPKKEPSYQSRTISHSPYMKFKTFDGRRVQHAFSIPKRGFDIASWSKNCTNICIHNLDSLKANPIESGVQKVAPFKRGQGGGNRVENELRVIKILLLLKPSQVTTNKSLDFIQIRILFLLDFIQIQIRYFLKILFKF